MSESGLGDINFYGNFYYNSIGSKLLCNLVRQKDPYPLSQDSKMRFCQQARVYR
jgi:hypothetical protein